MSYTCHTHVTHGRHVLFFCRDLRETSMARMGRGARAFPPDIYVRSRARELRFTRVQQTMSCSGLRREGDPDRRVTQLCAPCRGRPRYAIPQLPHFPEVIRNLDDEVRGALRLLTLHQGHPVTCCSTGSLRFCQSGQAVVESSDNGGVGVAHKLTKTT